MKNRHLKGKGKRKQAQYRITYASLSERGDREYNEDCVLTLQQDKRHVFAVADGLGGHGNGDVASRTVVDSVEAWFLNADREYVDQTDFIARAFECAQNALCRKKEDGTYGDMMTTMVLLSVEKQIAWGHVGDSRLYYFKDGVLQSQTLDHSVPQVLVYTEEITPEEIRHHPDRNRLLKAMGKDWEYGSEYVLAEPLALEGQQAFLLCSDGFWEHIVEVKMQQLLHDSATPEEWLKRMADEVRRNGAEYDMDNYSAVAVWVDSTR